MGRNVPPLVFRCFNWIERRAEALSRAPERDTELSALTCSGVHGNGVGDSASWAAIYFSQLAGNAIALLSEAIHDLSDGVADAVWTQEYGWQNRTVSECSFSDGAVHHVPPLVHAELIRHCDLLREIFGNPFRTAVLDPAWLTSDVLALTRQMYESRDFSTMPILADALQDVGCSNADILNHCRSEESHVRGCWVVDLVLGKQ